MELKLKSLSPLFVLPTYATDGSACFDLVAVEDVRIIRKEVRMIPLGFAVEVPQGFEMQVRARSGLSARGIFLANGIGTIDSDYRGEVKVLLYNSTDYIYCVKCGDRVAQAMICPVIRSQPVLVSTLEDTLRGEGGFGSTGS